MTTNIEVQSPNGLDTAMNFNFNNNNDLIQDLKIVQHNVLYWKQKDPLSNGLFNYYRLENPDLILINSTSVINNNIMKIYNYNVIQKNSLNERHAGIAIAIKKNIKHKIMDNFVDDILGIELMTTIVLTNYSPPRRNNIPIREIENILQKNLPVYFAGDINAHIPAMGYNDYNNNARIIKRLLEQNKIKIIDLILEHIYPEMESQI